MTLAELCRELASHAEQMADEAEEGDLVGLELGLSECLSLLESIKQEVLLASSKR